MYLEYDDYEEMGGTIDEDSFPRYEARARMEINRATFGRLTGREPAAMPESVKYCMYDLISAIHAGESTGGMAAGRAVSSMSNDGVSMSFSGNQTDSTRYMGIIRGWLAGETTACGLPLLYAGVDVR